MIIGAWRVSVVRSFEGKVTSKRCASDPSEGPRRAVVLRNEDSHENLLYLLYRENLKLVFVGFLIGSV